MTFYPIIAKVASYNIDNKLRIINHPIYAQSLSEAVKMIEEYYGQSLERVAVQYADCENTLFEISPDLAEHYIKEGALLDS